MPPLEDKDVIYAVTIIIKVECCSYPQDIRDSDGVCIGIKQIPDNCRWKRGDPDMYTVAYFREETFAKILKVILDLDQDVTDGKIEILVQPKKIQVLDLYSHKIKLDLFYPEYCVNGTPKYKSDVPEAEQLLPMTLMQTIIFFKG